jgi:hypothetical protein
MKNVLKTVLLTSAFCTALSFSESTIAFELKGVSLGDAKSTIDLKGCLESKKEPGMFSCPTTLGGDPAEISYLFHKDKVAGMTVVVTNGDLQPIKSALDDKFGPSRQPNQFIKEWQWIDKFKSRIMTIKEIRSGYHVTTVDVIPFTERGNELKNKAAKDL